MSAIDASLLIVSFNTCELLARCLESIPAAAGTFTCELVVVDNGSTDGTVAMLGLRFPGVVLVERPENPGLARSTNIGISRASGAGFASGSIRTVR